MDQAADQRPLAVAIGCIRQAAISLSSDVDAQLRAQAQKPDHHRSLRGLATELRLLGGALYSLETLAADLEPVASDELPAPQGEWLSLTVLRRFQCLLEIVGHGLGTASEADLRHFKEEAALCRSRVTYVLARSQTLQDLVLLLATSLEGAELGKDAQSVCGWLAILNSPYNNRQPRDYYLERRFVDVRQSEFPEYSYAAMRWPVYAEAYWSTLEHQAKLLFAMPRSFNFVQWALEYARGTWPDLFGANCRDPGAVIDLTDALCDGSASPLHLAAALGLPSLCQSLISSGANVLQHGHLGSPLYCALVGHDVLAATARPESWSSILRHGPEQQARHAVVHQLLQAGSDCTWCFQWQDDRTASLAGLAFWFSCLVDDHTVFERVVAGGAVVDDDFASLIADPLFAGGVRPSTSTLAQLVACAFDTTFDCGDDWPWYRQDRVLATIKGLMRDYQFSFAHGLTSARRLDHVTDVDFARLFRGAILDNELCYVRRLSMDPRFDPDLAAHPEANNGTVAHLAVGGNRFKLVDLLVAAGADFGKPDAMGRTPLLLVESTHMLSRLVHHGLPTTDTDCEGRNIWHYAVTTHDWGLLDWLAVNDPSKEQNLAAVTAAGYTPLDDALSHIYRLQLRKRCSVQPPQPIEALKILDAGASCATRPGPCPPFLMGVEWGSKVLVERLLAAGADPHATDLQGMSALHRLTVSASPALVSLVQSLCQGLPVGAGGEMAAGLSPAETILTNTPRVQVDGRWVPSEHPSCFARLSDEAYTLLLTPQVLGHHDASGLGTWARFCFRMVPRLDESLYKEASSVGAMDLVRTSLLTAIGCLIRQGALALYEDETGLPAVLCLADADTKLWLMTRLALAVYVLEHFNSPLTQPFVCSQDGQDLLDAVRAEEEALAERLASSFSTSCRPRSPSGDGEATSGEGDDGGEMQL